MHRNVARAQHHKKIEKRTSCSEWHRIVPISSATRRLVDLVRHSCFADLQLAVAKLNGTAARGKAWACYSCAMRDCGRRLLNALEQLREEKSWGAEMCRSYRRASWEAPLGKVREEVCSPDKTLLREEATERRGTSAKRPLSKDVAHSSIHLFIYPSSHSFIH